MKHRKMAFIVSILFVLICFVLYFFIYIIPDITGALTQTCVAEYGEMRISDKYPAIVVRDEVVHYAKISGDVTRYIDNNIKTRKGIKILDIFGASTENVLCPNTGVVSYYIDGYESVFTPESLADTDVLLPVDENKNTRIKIEVKDIRANHVEAEEPIYKVIGSDTWYTVIMVPNEDAERFSVDSKVSLGFGENYVAGKILNIVSKEDKTLVIVSTSKYLEDYDKIRELDVELVSQDEKGLIIPNTALTEVDGKAGVYVKQIDGTFAFCQVKVKASNDNEAVVYADQYSELRDDGLTDIIYTISLYDEILKDASEQDK